VSSHNIPVTDVEIDRNCGHRVYVALGPFDLGNLYAGGVFGTDDGETWNALSIGTDVQRAPVTDIEIDPTDSRYVYASTYGRGAWIYDRLVTPDGCD
jgi:hypothetical protein